MKRATFLLALALLPALASAQAARISIPDLTGLAEKARESVVISLDKQMLKSAGGFMGGGGGVSDAEFQELVKDLDAIQVRLFEFDKPGMYSMADIEPVLKQVRAQSWKNIMSMRDGDERVEMWLRDDSANGGMVFVASEANELVLINIAGKVNLEMLGKLQGRMGIPYIPGMSGTPSPARPAAPAPAAQPARPAAAPTAPPAPAAQPAPAAPRQL
jgi:hypothetical protein